MAVIAGGIEALVPAAAAPEAATQGAAPQEAVVMSPSAEVEAQRRLDPHVADFYSNFGGIKLVLDRQWSRVQDYRRDCDEHCSCV